jgi:hypothetical protein
MSHISFFYQRKNNFHLFYAWVLNHLTLKIYKDHKQFTFVVLAFKCWSLKLYFEHLKMKIHIRSWRRIILWLLMYLYFVYESQFSLSFALFSTCVQTKLLAKVLTCFHPTKDKSLICLWISFKFKSRTNKVSKLKLINGLHQVHEGALMSHLWWKHKVEKPSNTWELNG